MPVIPATREAEAGESLEPGRFRFRLMSGLASLDPKTSSRLGILTVAYYLWTTFMAVVVGIFMVSVIHPGSAAQKETAEQSGKPVMSSADALLDLIR
ncbi:Excitatory amino acid transporter 5 [Plecturocebus cupreus]